jgi:hypothetical protein
MLDAAILVSSILHRLSADEAKSRILLAQDVQSAVSPLNRDFTLFGKAQNGAYRTSPQSGCVTGS